MKKTYQTVFCELSPPDADILTVSELNSGYGDTVSWNLPSVG